MDREREREIGELELPQDILKTVVVSLNIQMGERARNGGDPAALMCVHIELK